MKNLLLIDASNLLFRSYYATAYTGNFMTTDEGLSTNGIFGFAHAMVKLLDNGYTHILVALDPKGKTHRHLEYKEYKGTRKETPKELIEQFPLMEEYLDALGVYYYQQDLMEADDIIGYATKHFKTDFDKVTIYSNDHDLMQLLDTNVSQIVSRKGLKEIETFTPDYLKEKMGISPTQMIDYKGLVGDASDNIPGVPGVGDKTAVKLLAEYHTLENLHEHIDNLKGKLKEKIENNKDIAIFSKNLATIKTDFDNTIDINKTEYTGYDYDKLLAFYKKVNFNSFIRNLDTEKPKKINEYVVINKPEEVSVILEKTSFLHLELFDTNYHDSKPIGFGVIFTEVPYYIPFEVAMNSPAFIKYLESNEYKKSVFDLKSLTVFLKWHNIEIKGIDFDLMLAAYLKSSSVNQDEFTDVATLYQYTEVNYNEKIYGKGAKHTLPLENVYIPHIISKVVAIKHLKPLALEDLQKHHQETLLNKIEIPLAKALADMEYTGIRVDQDNLELFGKDLVVKGKKAKETIYELAGVEFNINSPKQLGEVLFERMGLPVDKKTKTGYSTNISVLNKLKTFSPIIQKIIDYRGYTKLYSTYYEGLKQSLSLKSDSKIHTLYQQALTKTGRLSSKEPNLQNIPIRSEEGRELRKVFIPEENHVLLSFDYSQIELRVLAEMGNVLALKKAFINNKDIHNETAKLIFHKEDISSNERSIAKAINFSIIYGKTPWGLSEDLNITLKQANQFIDNYYENYPEIKDLTNKNIEFASENGYVLTKYNRIIHINEIKAKSYQTREFGKRIAMNAPIQGTAADILKIAMVKIYDEFKKQSIKSKMILQIHDEIVLDVYEDELEKVTHIVKDIMENCVEFETNLVANYSSGKNLYEVK